ncbi:hypothetical protein Trydic_g16491 [Trypoxylus dichotomus]
MKSVALLLFSFVTLISTKPLIDTESCGYESCNKVDSTKINIHLVPHSHDDVGWLKTVDQYYYGARNAIQEAGVQHIIGSVIQALQKDATRRFIQVETAFFWQWWQDQSVETRKITKELVNSGRLEIINGAWSMNDEAAAHYHSIIDQFTLGLKRINDTLGRCGRPRIGWQIDPFGHSKEMASMFSQIGFEGMFFARLDYRDSKKRHVNKDLELIWHSSSDLGSASNIFTGVLYDFYTAPAYFCWDVLCGDRPVIDNKKSPDYNVDVIVDQFAAYAIKGLQYYKTNNLLVTMGGDFTYQAAEMYFTNMDKLIEGFKEYRPDINIIYSTPSCYLKAVNEEAKSKNIQFQLKTDDFFPYASGAHTYWTGYFTSRPNSKRFERQANNLLQVMKQAVSFTKYRYHLNFEDNLTPLKEAMGIMQHHDAITGTEKQHVVQDYVRLLTASIKEAEENIDKIVTNLLKKTDDTDNVKINFVSCLLANVSYCEQSNLEKFVVAIYNPLSKYVNHYVRLPVNGDSYIITGPNGTINYEILPVIDDFIYVYSITPSKYELVFLAENLPPLGLRLFHIQKSVITKKRKPRKSQQTRFGNAHSGFTIDEETGLLSSITLNGDTLEVSQNFMFYNGANGSNTEDIYRASGAYIFRPAGVTPTALSLANTITYTSYSTDLVDEVHQVFNSWIKQIIRVYRDEDYIEFDWLVGPIATINDLGVEVITRFTTNRPSNRVFYTDSNGKQMVKRIRNFRDMYDYTNEEPVSGNYYPVTSKIVLKDGGSEACTKGNHLEVAVLNDRAQGGSSLEDGQIELMVHRRLLKDDAFGVGEALNEYEFNRGVVVRGQHLLTFGQKNSCRKKRSGKSASATQKDLEKKKILSPWVFVGDSTDHTLEDLQSNFNFEFSGLTKALPDNVQILTLEPWNEESLLLRLEHIFSVNEDATLSQIATVHLDNLFTLFDVVSIEEMNLAANMPKADIEKMSWNTYDYGSGRELSKAKNIDLTIRLEPMEIRTFIVQVVAKSHT